LAEVHFWVASFGILLYVVAIYSAGVTQGLMWRAFDSTGRLAYPDFIETVLKLMPMYWMRAIGGTLFIVGMLLCHWNILMACRRRTAVYAVPVIQATALTRGEAGSGKREEGALIPAFISMSWHRMWERRWAFFTVMTVLAVVVASLFEILPTFL